MAAFFLFVASITGAILSFSPIENELSSFHSENLSDISVSTLIDSLQKNNLEIIEILVDNNNFLQSSVINNNGEGETFYTNANTGKKVGNIINEPYIYNFSRNLHRSLNLKKTGRLLIGIVTFLLFLIAISGSILLIKKQLKLKKFFSKIIYDNFYQYWHSFLSRYSLFIIIIISLSGTYLSLIRFDILPKKEKKELLDKNPNSGLVKVPFNEFPIFKKTKLQNIESIEFPFSTDSNDFFTLKLKNREILINQFNGNIIKVYDYGIYYDLYNLSYNIHTGKGNVIWSIILCIASLSILFFIFSGFKITYKRLFSKGKNSVSIDESNILILVGSENGSTMHFARQFYQELILHKRKVHIETMNNYKQNLKAKKIIIMTSTYGDGDAPANASNFIKKFRKKPIDGEFQYSVVGFGSTFYPNFCQYAKDVNEFLASFKLSKCVAPLSLVNNRSEETYNKWKREWKVLNDIPIEK